MEQHYGAIVIGAGPGGYPCAIRLGQLGVRTLIVDKEYWGGVCLNVGCIPSKALIGAAHRFEHMKHSSDMGLFVEGEVRVDFSRLMAWKGEVVGKLTSGVRTLLKANKVDMLMGTARLTGRGQVTVSAADGDKVFTADHVVLATGSSPIQVPGFDFADPPVIDSTRALALQSLPRRMVVVGGGYIGLEMAGVFSKFGTRVTVVEMMDQLLPGFDPDVVKILAKHLAKDGIEAHLSTKALGWEQTADGIEVEIEGKSGERRKLPADYVLVTVGRRPNTRGLGLEDLGVEMNGPFVKVDAQLKTNVPGLYAVGDCAGNPMLAHKATHDGEVCAEVIAGHQVANDAVVVPAVVFTDPEIAIAGLSEPEARAQGKEILVGKVPWGAIGKAIASHNTEGFVKVIVDAGTRRILGVTIVGENAGDLISEAALAIEMAAEAIDLGLTIHPHPSRSEGLMEAAKAALGEAIHVVNR